MNNRLIFSRKKFIRIARKRGLRDGKNQIPRQEWGADSVPYLIQLNKQFAATGKELDLELEELKLKIEDQKIVASKNEIIEKTKSSHLTERLGEAEKNLKKFENQLEGSKDEVPMAKFARVRMIGNLFYVPILLALAFGEFLITYPALQNLLGERDTISIFVAAAVSLLTISVSHMLGIHLKSLYDRTKPKSLSQNNIFFILGILVVASILFISYIRANNAMEFANQLEEISSNLRLEFLWALYAVLQLAFFATGIVMSYMHYSQIETDISKSKWVVRYYRFLKNRQEKKKAKSEATAEKTNIDLTNKLIQNTEVLKQKKEYLIAQYEEVAAVYRDSNIHARRDEMDGAHLALKEPELVF